MNRQQSTSISGNRHPENHKGEGSTPTVWQVFGSDSRNAANPEMVPRAALLRRRPRRVRMRRDEIVDRRLHAALLVRDAGERERHFGRADAHDTSDRRVSYMKYPTQGIGLGRCRLFVQTDFG